MQKEARGSISGPEQNISLQWRLEEEDFHDGERDVRQHHENKWEELLEWEKEPEWLESSEWENEEDEVEEKHEAEEEHEGENDRDESCEHHLHETELMHKKLEKSFRVHSKTICEMNIKKVQVMVGTLFSK